MTTKNYDIGAAKVFWTPKNGTKVDLGDTQGGVKVSINTETHEIVVDQHLDAVDEIITKRTTLVDVPLAEFTMENLNLAFAGSEIVEDKLVFKSAAGGSLIDYAGQLVLHPLDADADDHSKDFTFPVAAPMGSSEFTYDNQNIKVISVQFKAFPNADGVTMTYGA